MDPLLSRESLGLYKLFTRISSSILGHKIRKNGNNLPALYITNLNPKQTKKRFLKSQFLGILTSHNFRSVKKYSLHIIWTRSRDFTKFLGNQDLNTDKVSSVSHRTENGSLLLKSGYVVLITTSKLNILTKSLPHVKVYTLYQCLATFSLYRYCFD